MRLEHLVSLEPWPAPPQPPSEQKQQQGKLLRRLLGRLNRSKITYTEHFERHQLYNSPPPSSSGTPGGGPILFLHRAIPCYGRGRGGGEYEGDAEALVCYYNFEGS